MPAADMLDLSPALAPTLEIGRPYRNERPTDLGPSVSGLQAQIVADAASAVACDALHLRYSIRNIDRTIGATLAGEIARRFGDEGLPPGTIRLDFDGTAGQSFGAFGIEGMMMRLVGEANDYVAKVVSAAARSPSVPRKRRPTSGGTTPSSGTPASTGQPGGALYAAGRAGERFAVRNSGAVAVVEGVGDHGRWRCA
ncbi:MAG: hypothetical protein U0822_24890 [Anaerolineae bacterium]